MAAAAPTAVAGGGAAPAPTQPAGPAAAPAAPKNDIAHVLQHLGVAALRTRIQDLRSTIERILHTFLTNPSSNWTEALAQFSIVNVELLSLVEDIKPILKAFVVYPRNVNASIAPILPIMLSSKLLPELEADEASLKEQILTPLSNLTHHAQAEKLQKQIELVRSVCDVADKALADARKNLGLGARQGLPVIPTIDKVQASKVLEQEKLLHAAANFGEGLRISPDQRVAPLVALPPHMTAALASGDQATEGARPPAAGVRTAAPQQMNPSGPVNMATGFANSPRPANLMDMQPQHALQQQQQRPSMVKAAQQRFPQQRFAQGHPGQQSYQPVKVQQYPQSHQQIQQQLQQQQNVQLQQHLQLQLQQQSHMAQGNQMRTQMGGFANAPSSSLLSQNIPLNQPLAQHRLQQFGLSQPQRGMSSGQMLTDPLYIGSQSMPGLPMQQQLPGQLPGQPTYGLMNASPSGHVLNQGGMLSSNPASSLFNQGGGLLNTNGMAYGQPRAPPPPS